jgi:hypothetical protein
VLWATGLSRAGHFVEKTETQQETSFFRILKNEGQSYVNTRMSKDFVEKSNKGQGVGSWIVYQEAGL